MLKLSNILLSLDGLPILKNLSAEIPEGKITGLIGPNGAGKSTVFHVISGMMSDVKGSIRFRNQEILGLPSYQIARLGITRTFQDAMVFRQSSVSENLMVFSPQLWDETLQRIFFGLKASDQLSFEAKEEAYEKLRCVGLESRSRSLAKDLSYGQTKLLEILKVMMSRADFILLDEPFSGLFPEMIKVIIKLIRQLASIQKTVVLVEHNMKLIEEICDHVIVLDSGEKIAEGSFLEIRKNPSVIEAYLGN